MNLGQFSSCVPGNGTAENLYRIPTAGVTSGDDGSTLAGVDGLSFATAGEIALTSTGTARSGSLMTIEFTASTILNNTALSWGMSGTGCQDAATNDPRTLNCEATN